jgi:hypothetical protein
MFFHSAAHIKPCTLLRFFNIFYKNFFGWVCSKIAPSDVPLAAPASVHGCRSFYSFAIHFFDLVPDAQRSFGPISTHEAAGDFKLPLLFCAYAFFLFFPWHRRRDLDLTLSALWSIYFLHPLGLGVLLLLFTFRLRILSFTTFSHMLAKHDY